MSSDENFALLSVFLCVKEKAAFISFLTAAIYLACALITGEAIPGISIKINLPDSAEQAVRAIPNSERESAPGATGQRAAVAPPPRYAPPPVVVAPPPSVQIVPPPSNRLPVLRLPRLPFPPVHSACGCRHYPDQVCPRLRHPTHYRIR